MIRIANKLFFLRGWAKFSYSAFALVALLATLMFSNAYAQEKEPLAAFENFVVSGDLKAAHFYLQNNLLKQEDIETSRLFVEAIFLSNSRQSAGQPFSTQHLPSIDLLYNYLNAIRPIDLNGLHRCGIIGVSLDGQYVCNLSSFLFNAGSSQQVFDFFLKRGMNMKAFSTDTLPPVVVFVGQLGVRYSLKDLNWFAEHGAPLGPESYTHDQLKNWGGLITRGYLTAFPSDKPESSLFNFLDLLSLSIVNTKLKGRELNQHRDFLCRYVAHVSGQIAPTFDHFSYLLRNVDSFRGDRIGQASHPSQWGNVNRAVFPHSCRLLVEAMARSSLKLDAMINLFGANADLQTAQWLVSLKQNGGTKDVQSN